MNGNPTPFEQLRAAGLRVTGPRVAILATLMADATHPTAEQLHERIRADHPSISLSTVYKTIESLLSAGLCRRVSGDDRRLRVDGTRDDHDHAVCRGCGRVFDVGRELCPRPQPLPVLPHGLSLQSVRVEYEVLCSACADLSTGATQEIPAP